MTPLFLLAAAAAATPSAQPVRSFEACAVLVKSDPDQAVAAAEAWRVTDGGLSARQCLGLAYAALGRFLSGAVAFEQAARVAEAQQDARASDLWTQAGNAYLLGGEPAKARTAFDSALAQPGGNETWRGEIRIDRARAAVDMGDVAAARADLDEALKLAPGDPVGWLLSATLARREGQIERAAQDISQAERLAPEDAAILVEAGNIAALSGNQEGARSKWTAAIARAPGSPAANAAAAALAANID